MWCDNLRCAHSLGLREKLIYTLQVEIFEVQGLRLRRLVDFEKSPSLTVIRWMETEMITLKSCQFRSLRIQAYALLIKNMTSLGDGIRRRFSSLDVSLATFILIVQSHCTLPTRLCFALGFKRKNCQVGLDQYLK